MSVPTCAEPAYAHTRLDDIKDVNWRVNKLPLTDCKSQTWEKIARLKAKGINSLFVVVFTETGGGHAIAVVDGKYALDNRQRDVMTVSDLRKLGYQIAQLPGEP